MTYSLINILYGAQNGDAVSNFARQFGLGFDDTERVMEALMPAFSRGFKRNTATPMSLANFLDILGKQHHVRYWQEPLAAFEPGAIADGTDILVNLFGPEGLSYAIAKEVSRRTDVPRETVQAMMPPIAATLVGGIAEELPHTSFGELIDAYLAGFQRGRPEPQTEPATEPEGDPSGPLSFFDAVGNFFDGLARGRPQTPPPLEEPIEEEWNEAVENGALAKTGEDLFGDLLDAGVETGQTHVATMADLFDRFWDLTPRDEAKED